MNVKIDFSQADFKLVNTELASYSTELVKKGFSNFLKKPIDYKHKYLQSKMNNVFDGYSYLGQSDSLNQYDTDLLHSFVLSEFSPINNFPIEFHDFFNSEWKSLKRKIQEIEKKIITELNIDGLLELYTTKMGHMVSCNYYPKTNKLSSKNIKHRLSEHKDVSLFTVFVFGNSDGFSYKNKDELTVRLGEIDRIVLFPGYLLEVLTKGKIKATQHQVEFDTNKSEERFSFAFFSVPKPNEKLELDSISITSENYYKQYLSLF